MSAERPVVMVVDDSSESLELLRVLLESIDIDVRLIGEGSQAAEAARTAPPDLILLDILMPDVSGFDVCRELKRDAGTRDVPVIFISAKREVGDKVEGFALGGVDYITKPFAEEEVLARVKTHLALGRAHEALRRKNLELVREIERRKQVERERETLISNLEKALADVKKLESMLPICANCKKIRDDNGYWSRIEQYFLEHSDVTFTHGICPACAKELYDDK